jgi:hypothetical protein
LLSAYVSLSLRYLAEKERAFFRQRELRKCTGNSVARKVGQKGLIEKINANNLRQRKLFLNTPV